MLNDSNIKELYNRRGKVVCTLGPSSNSLEVIREMALAGMNVARLNFSHGTHEEHTEMVSILRQVSLEIDRPIGILQDLQGPKIRIGKFENGPVELSPGEEFVLTTESILGNQNRVSVSYPNFPMDVSPGQMVLLDDGLFLLEVLTIEGTEVKCRVNKGGLLKNNKGLNLPGSALSIDVLTPKDRKDLQLGIQLEVDFIALSFVQHENDVKVVKKIIAESGKDIPVIAKIEKPQAVERIRAIIKAADGIMIARGDLGVEMRVEEVPSIQKRIIDICGRRSKPVITATQMLESMVSNFRPTRAEASDVANAILDGTDAVMLSAESASGKYPVESVRTMVKIISHTERMHRHEMHDFHPEEKKHKSISTSICSAACHCAKLVDAQAIVCLTERGRIAQTLTRYRPSKTIIAISSSAKTLRKLTLVWGVYPVWGKNLKQKIDSAIVHLLEYMKSKEVVKTGDILVLTLGQPFISGVPTNSLQIHEVP